MRIKQLWDVVPIPSKLKLAYSLVTLNPTTTTFLVLSLLQCIFQNGFHGWAVSHHISFISRINEVALNTQVITQPLAVLSGDQLFLCDKIPRYAGGPGKCTRAAFQEQKLPPSASVNLGASSTLVQIPTNGTQPNALGPAARQCAEVYPWIFQELRATSREDMLFITYQLWLFSISLLAILHQSIPHLMTAIASEILAVVATTLRVIRTPRFEANFDRFVTNGACPGTDLLPGYFPSRHIVEILICVLNSTIFVALAGLSYRLVHIYGRNSFEKVQRKPDMSRLYIVILSLSSSIHLAAFFLVASLALLTDQLLLGPLRELASDRTSSIVIHAVTYALIPPWLFLGWTCGRVESKPRTAAFIGITLVFLILWAGSFTCSTNRFVFLSWDFFAALTIGPGCIVIFNLLLAIYIWHHLDLGLAAYLKRAEPPHPADQVRWSFARRLDAETGDSPTSEDGYMKRSIIWDHSPLPASLPAVPTHLPGLSMHSISEEDNNPGDTIKSISIPLYSASPPENTTPKLPLPPVPAPLPIAQRTQTGFCPVKFTRSVMSSQKVPLRRLVTDQPSTPMDVTDSWMRRHLASSIIVSPPTTLNDPLRGLSPAPPA